MMSLLSVGCSTKTEYVYLKPKPFKFQSTQLPKIREIRVHSKDMKLYTAYIKNFRNIILFHNQQIKDYEISFDNNTTKKEE
jgi:hypothetical protein